MSKIKVKLAKKVKYHGKRNTAGAEIVINQKDVKFFKDNELISEVVGSVEETNESPKKQEDSKKDDSPQKKESETPTDEELDKMTVAELMGVAQDVHLEGRTSLRNDKDKLLAAVKKAIAEKDGE